MAELTIPLSCVPVALAALAIALASLAAAFFIGLICTDFISLIYTGTSEKRGRNENPII